MSDRSWIWKARQWSAFPDFNTDFLARAKNLDNQEQMVAERCSGLNVEDITWMLANDIVANWHIEGICLNRQSVRHALDMALIEPGQKTVCEKHAAEAFLEAFSDTSMLTLEHILSLHKKLQNDTHTDWGKLRKHAESVYGITLQGECYSVYDAPPENYVPSLMEKYITWWNYDSRKLPRVAGSILAHLYFVTIHPFRDGNGRLARILADKYLTAGKSVRTYCISHEIEQQKTAYYMALESITPENGMSQFLDFMLVVYANAFDQTEIRIKLLLQVYQYCDSHNIQLARSEKDLIKTLVFSSEKQWSFFEATQYFEDGEDAEYAWRHLHELGFLQQGRFSIPEDAPTPTPA